MSGHSAVPQVEVVASTRRRWTEAERGTILSEADQDGVTVSEVARRHGLSPSLLFRWRRELGKTKRRVTPEPTFVPLALPTPALPPDAPKSAPSRSVDRIEIVLAGGRTIIVGKDVDTAALRRIVDVLELR